MHREFSQSSPRGMAALEFAGMLVLVAALGFMLMSALGNLHQAQQERVHLFAVMLIAAEQTLPNRAVSSSVVQPVRSEILDTDPTFTKITGGYRWSSGRLRLPQAVYE